MIFSLSLTKTLPNPEAAKIFSREIIAQQFDISSQLAVEEFEVLGISQRESFLFRCKYWKFNPLCKIWICRQLNGNKSLTLHFPYDLSGRLFLE